MYSTITTAGGYPSASTGAAQRDPQVAAEMDRLASTCEKLEAHLNSLEARLTQVLTPKPQTAETNQAVPEPVRVPLAQAIHDRVKHLSQLSEQLQSLIGRIEV